MGRSIEHMGNMDQFDSGFFKFILKPVDGLGCFRKGMPNADGVSGFLGSLNKLMELAMYSGLIAVDVQEAVPAGRRDMQTPGRPVSC